MAAEVVLQRSRHIVALRDDAHGGGRILHDFVHEQGVVGAGQDEGVDVGIEAEHLVEPLFDKIVRTGRVVLAVFHQRHPHRAGHPRDRNVGVALVQLEFVTAGADGALRGQDADMAGVGEAAHHLHRGADDAQHAALAAEAGEVVLLNGAEGFGRSGVAGQDDEFATAVEEGGDGFKGVAIDHIERARTIGGSCVVAKVEVVVLREEFANLPQNGQAAIA